MKERMASLSALLQDLADRIASKEDGSTTQLDDDDPVVVRFRCLLPSLLESYFVPLKVKERESVAILKLLNHTVSLYPAVLHHGKGHAVLPIMGRIIPLLAEPSRRANHLCLFETLSSLVSILRNGDTNVYAMLFSGSLLLIEDIRSVASFFSSVSSFTSCTSICLQCYTEAYEAVNADSDGSRGFVSDSTQQWKSTQGPGLLINVTGDERWLPLALWTLTSIRQCLADGPLLVEGRLSFSFIEAVGMLLSYGDSNLHKAALGVIRLASTLMGVHTFPSERLILSVLSLLSERDGLLLPFRDNAYDTEIGSCLIALYSSSSSEVIESTAPSFVNVFPTAITRTTSIEFRVTMCEVFGVILKHCPSYIKHLALLLQLASMPEMRLTLSYCIQLALDILGPEVVAGLWKEQTISGGSRIDETLKASHNRNVPSPEEQKNHSLKRQKMGLKPMCSNEVNIKICPTLGIAATTRWPPRYTLISEDVSEPDIKSVTQRLHEKLLQIIESLQPNPTIVDETDIDNKLVTLSTLARSFSGCPGTLYRHLLVKELPKWIPWLQRKALDGSLLAGQLAMFLEAIDKLLAEKGACGNRYTRDASALSVKIELDNFLDAFATNGCTVSDVLMLPWSVSYMPEVQHRMKCRALSISVKVSSQARGACSVLLSEVAYKDDDSAIRAAAVKALPVLAAWSGAQEIRKLCRQFCLLRMDKADEVRKAVARNIGLVVCAFHTSQADLESQAVRFSMWSMWGEFVCPLCDSGDCSSRKVGWNNVDSENLEDGYIVGCETCLFPLDMWELLFSQLLFGEISEYVQVAFIESFGRLLQHMTVAELELTKASWLKCMHILPLHHRREVREAFSLQVHAFIRDKVLEGLFGSSEEDATSSRELRMLGILKHALYVSSNPEVIETLMETVAEVAQAARHCRQLLFFSLVLIIEQVDNADVSIQVTSVRLLHKIAAVGWPERKSRGVQSMFESLQEELFQYLCGRIITRPSMIKEVAEAVLSVDMSDLLKQMIPVALPQLILDQQQNCQALDILHELARLLETELPYLLVEFCHQVLSVLLLRADGSELLAALQFYEAQTGSETREIFAAVLPALLDELVRFLGDVDGEAPRRSTRVVPMIQEVASIVTGSDDLPSFLRTHFVGLLNSIDRKLLRATDLASQKQALRCIQRLIDMIGHHLSAFVPKIMVLLTRALQERSLQADGLAAWLFFVQTLARVAPANLKTVASQVVVALMPCLEVHLEEETQNLSAVVSVLEELIITSRVILEDQIRELPLLPTHVKLAKVNAVLHEAKGLLSLWDQLQQAVDGLCHESLSVRYTTAKELIKWMQNKKKEIAGMILGEIALDAIVINNLMTALLRGCSDESRTSMSQRFRMACAECLGELGAIDPVKMQVNLRHRSKMERCDEDLVFELINEHLAKVLRAGSDTDAQDAAALAIQELLKFSGCKADLLGGCPARPSGSVQTKTKSFSSEAFERTKRTKNICVNAQTSTESGDQLWRRFSEDVKEIIAPCLTSKYHLRNSGTAMPAGPIFRSGISFRRWIYLWVRRLVSQSTGGRADIFTACRGVVRHDMGTALYLLPYLVLNVICHGPIEVRNCVKKEILSVLAEASSLTPEPAPSDANLANVPISWSGPSEMSIQCVFTLLDNLGQWLDDSKMAVLGGTVDDKEKQVTNLSLQHKHVSELLDAIPKQALAGASFRCQAYARALLYFESHVRATSGALNPAAHITGALGGEDVSILLEIFSGLDETDGLTGLSRLRKTLSLQDQILINEKTGNWAEALTCCEQALQLEPTSITRHSGVLNCLLNMGHLQAMVTHVDGLILRFPNNKKEWCLRGVQAAWRLGQWDLLDEYVEGALIDGPLSPGADSNAAFDIWLAKMLQALQREDQASFQEHLTQCRKSLLAPLAAASMESYSRAYPLILKLHMLKELEDFHVLSCKNDSINEGSDSHQIILRIVEEWEDRLELTQQSLWTREPILALRRLGFKAGRLPAEVGTCWLQYAKLCRTAGHFETASRAILEAQSAGAQNVHMEKAKLLWETQKSHRAIVELQHAIPCVHLGRASSPVSGVFGQDTHLPSAAGAGNRSVGATIGVQASQLRRDNDRDMAKMLLRLARWVHHTGQKHREDVLNLFSSVRELQPKWEKAFFYVAKYYDDLLVDARRRQEEGQDTNTDIIGAANQRRKSSTGVMADDKPWWSYLPDVILFYAKGLHRGHRRLFQALPRLLTLWFEFGYKYRGESLSSVKGVKAVHTKLLNIVRGCLKELPSYQWLTALSQLVSRICHPNEEVVKLVKIIITTVIRAYPHQALWTMAAVSKSTVQARREAGTDVLRQAASGESDKMLFNQFAGFIEQMIKLCFYGGDPKAKNLSIAADFGTLKRMMPLRVIMPVQQALTVALPADGLTNSTFNPFSVKDNSTIHGIKDGVEVLASLQRPKKVVLLSSDGIEHPFLCKPKDDLRKDARMMEFTTMINRLLSKDPKSRRRKLYIRTFAVIPLTEESGMIEWVIHTRGLRHILQDLYVAAGVFDRRNTNPQIKKIYDQNQGQKPGGEMLRTKILPLFPPIFHRWFLNTFAEPAAWFRARVAYAHTSAVWSMVGHILGLGDRHGENILFDSTTGDCVHVDFSCLFDKGLTLEKPELVPFRLTQNMVDGLGITGYEGTFIQICEITLSILRTHRETLMSVLEPFIHDPLVEWTKMHKSSGVEVQNPHAQLAIANIEARLQGVVVGVGAAPSLPLSVEGQADRLIASAVSHENLEKMYIWWMAWF